MSISSSCFLFSLGIEGRNCAHGSEEHFGCDLDGRDSIRGAGAVVVIVVVESEGRGLGAGSGRAGLVARRAGVVVVVVGRHLANLVAGSCPKYWDSFFLR